MHSELPEGKQWLMGTQLKMAARLSAAFSTTSTGSREVCKAERRTSGMRSNEKKKQTAVLQSQLLFTDSGLGM